jgi:hypothetical protein
MLPYSRLVSPPADSAAQEPTEVLVVPNAELPALIRECEAITTILVHVMLDRSRHFTSAGLQDEKMASLGKLSAGLAHALNNPAAAIERSAALLADRLDDVDAAVRLLGTSTLTDDQLAAVDAMRVSCLDSRSPGVLSPIQQAQREDAIDDWLVEHGLDAAIAGPLSETAVTLEVLDRIAARNGGRADRRGAAPGVLVKSARGPVVALWKPHGANTLAPFALPPMDSLRAVLRLLVVLGLVLSTQSLLLLQTAFTLRHDYIAEHLCINRDRPELECDGKCYLMRQMEGHGHGEHGHEDDGAHSHEPVPAQRTPLLEVALSLTLFGPERPVLRLPPEARTAYAVWPASPLAEGIPIEVFHPPRVG